MKTEYKISPIPVFLPAFFQYFLNLDLEPPDLDLNGFLNFVLLTLSELNSSSSSFPADVVPLLTSLFLSLSEGRLFPLK